ncbi:hypothetical protein QAD02_007573 [Eretmocerus hayati]|uniref:Uncharacterized protein n=1 Tax=Eretmocerus hayati TaxID=131215 RepID=A0ACC2N4U3_9HYME|nr:hypothetical protein QAD02_007573 [Eretmocerus hayati]
MLKAIRNMVMKSEERIRKYMEVKIDDSEKSNEDVFKGIDIKLGDLGTETTISGNDTKEQCRTWILQKLHVTVTVKNTCHMKGTTDLTGAELETEKTKKEVMENRNNLKGRDFYIGNSLTYTKKDHKRELKKIAKEMRVKEKKKVVARDRFLLIGEENNGSKEHKKGRCSGGTVFAYKMRCHDPKTTLVDRETIAKSLRTVQRTWILISTYMDKNKEKIPRIWEQLTEKYQDLIAGDMNARTANKGGNIERERTPKTSW